MPFKTSAEYLSKPLSRADFVKPAPPAGDLLFQPIDVWDQLYGEDYKLVMYAVLPDGAKAKVVLDSVPVTFDVMVPPGVDAEQFKAVVHGLLDGAKTKDGAPAVPHAMTVVEQYWFRGFSVEPYKWLRLHFRVLKARNAALSIVCKAHEADKTKKVLQGVDVEKHPAMVLWNTANDFGGNFRAPHNGFPLKVIREHGNLSPAGWNRVPRGRYRVVAYPDELNEHTQLPKNTYVIEAALRDVAELPKAEVSALGLAKSPALALHWDIEAYGHRGPDAGLPDPRLEPDVMFMASFAVCRVSRKDPLHSVIAFFVPGMPAAVGLQFMREQRPALDDVPDATYVVCDDERDLCQVVVNIMGSVLPDYWVDFNGLSFDQQYLLHRLARYPDQGGASWTAPPRPKLTYDGGVAPVTLLDRLAIAMETPYNGWPRPFVEPVERGGQYVVDPEGSFKWARKSVKISPEKMEVGHSMQLPGVMYVDARPVMMQAFPKESQSSLKVFLKLSKLPPKHDMPVLVMHKLFRAPTSQVRLKDKEYVYADFVEYALYDAVACHALFYKSNIYVRWQATANISGTTLHNAYYHAGGMKARNMISAAGFAGVTDLRGRRYPIAFSEPDSTVSGAPRKEKTDKQYPGAFVIPPLFYWDGKCWRPVAALDFASLYPSIIMTDNISHEMMVYDEAMAAALIAAGWDLKPIEFPWGDAPYRAWVVRYRFEDAEMEREVGMGALPTVLSRLKVMRDEMKQDMKRLEHAIEDGRKTGRPTDDEEYELSVVDGQQKALKVLMNTFYGECGNQISPFFFVGMAGAITSFGQFYLRYVKGLAEADGFTVVYGDTDSIYCMPPVRALAAVDAWHDAAVAELRAGQTVAPPPCFTAEVATWAKKKAKTDDALVPAYGRHEQDLHPAINDPAAPPEDRARRLEEEWRARRVIIAMYEIARLNDHINQKLVETTGTKRMSMAYEEVLEPCCFFGKKKYVGVQNATPDRKLIGFDWRAKAHNFIRGLDFIKRGNAPIMSEIGIEALARALDVCNTKTVRQVVEELIAELPQRRWELDSFVKSAEYKPSKQNVMVHRFVERMTAMSSTSPMYRVPEPGERFDYVMVRRAAGASAFGYKIDVKAGDKMEYPEVAAATGQEVDLEHYMSSSIRGLLARLISYDAQFRGAAVVTRDQIDDIIRRDRLEEDLGDGDDLVAEDSPGDDEAASVAGDAGGADDAADVTDAKAVAAAGKVVQRLLRAAFSNGMPAVDLTAAKRRAADRIKLIHNRTSGAQGFTVYTSYVKAGDQAAAKGKAAAPTDVAAVFDEDARARSLATPTNAEAAVRQLVADGNTLEEIYKWFMGQYDARLRGRTPGLAHRRQDVLEAERRACLSEVREIDVLLADTGVFNDGEPDDATLEIVNRLNVVYYRLVGVHIQLRTTAEIVTYLTARRTGVVSRPADFAIPPLNVI